MTTMIATRDTAPHPHANATYHIKKMIQPEKLLNHVWPTFHQHNSLQMTVRQYGSNSFACMTITIRVGSMAHLLIF